MNEVVCHGIPGPQVLKNGDIINVDVTTYFGGFHGDTSATFYVGTPTADGRKVTAVGKSGQAEPFAQGLDDPKGLAASKTHVFVADKTRIVKIDKDGKTSDFVKASDFPQPPLFLNDLTFDAKGNLYVSDSGDIQNGGKGAVFRITPQGKVSLVVSEAQDPAVKGPNGLLFDRAGRLLILDFPTGTLLRMDLGTKKIEKLADGFGGGDGIAIDSAGMLYLSDWKGGRVWKFDVAKKDAKPVQYAQTFQSAADITLSADGKFILVPDMKAGTLNWLPK